MRTSSRIAVIVGAALMLAACTNGDDAENGAQNGQDVEGASGSTTAPTADLTDTSMPPIDHGAVTDGVTVTGSGVATGEPDVVLVAVGVEVEREDVQEALNDANAATTDVLTALDDEGVAEQDRQTRDFSVHPVHQDDGQGQVELAGYGVRNLVEATVHDVDNVGTIVQAAAEAAGDDARVEGVRFDLEDDGEQLLAAREAALADARDKAAQYAEMLGVELGEPIAIEERTLGAPRQAETADQAQMDAAESVPIESGEQDVTVEVTARWSFE